MGGSARYRLAKKIREGKISKEEINSFYVFVPDGEDDLRNLSENDIHIYGWYGNEDEPNSGYIELDKNGNPVRLMPLKRDSDNGVIPDKNMTFTNIEGGSYTAVREEVDQRRNERDEDEDRYWSWWDNGGKEKTMYGL